ncbi:MAG: hypothetical protein AAGC67_11095 [Myxococcota bacterium]
MKIGIDATARTARGSVAARVEHARIARPDGSSSHGAPEHPTGGMDTLAVRVCVGPHVQRTEIDLAAIPTYPRHPVTRANPVLTARAATESRFMLAIGLAARAGAGGAGR